MAPFPLPPAENSPAAARPVFNSSPRPPTPSPHQFCSPPASRLPSNPNHNYPQLAPRPPDPPHFLHPAGRGFQSRTLPGRAPSVFPYLDPGQGNPGFVRPIHLPHAHLGSGPGSSGTMPGVVKGFPVSASNHSKVGLPSNSVSDNNGHNSLRDRNRDNALTVVRDRKVRITENATLYTLCRSWLRNGFPEETQPRYFDAVKSLPRPLPVAAAAQDKLVEEQEDEDKECLEELSEKELLQRHIKRAKRVRSRLREERIRQISRYKTRLALLLPPIAEQQLRKESTEAN